MQNGKQNGSAHKASANGSNAQGQPSRQPGKRPVHTVRFGAIKAAIWLNDTSVGPIHNVTVTRSYKDGETWKDSGSFGFDDLLPLAKALNYAHSWINEQRSIQSEARTEVHTEDESVPV